MLFSQVRQYIKGLLSRTFSNKSVLDKLSESDNKLTYNGNIIYPNGSAHAGFTPVGTVISVMGVSAPTNYLACNGQIVNITDYPELANYFEQQFGSKNKFGGDGTTTFAVPDLRGEFLRGTGTNGHENQGSGAAVGTHQDGTEMPEVYANNGTICVGNLTGTNGNINYDSKRRYSTTENSRSKISTTNLDEWGFIETLRPTNTSVLYCIATKNIYIDARYNYSLEEQVVGTWIDGKPLYEKTVFGSTPSTINTSENFGASLSSLSIEYINVYEGTIIKPETGGDSTFFYINTSGWTVWINKNTIRNSVSTNNLVSLDGYITICYTKTTD